MQEFSKKEKECVLSKEEDEELDLLVKQLKYKENLLFYHPKSLSPLSLIQKW